MATAARVNIDTEVKYALGFALAQGFTVHAAGQQDEDKKNVNVKQNFVSIRR